MGFELRAPSFKAGSAAFGRFTKGVGRTVAVVAAAPAKAAVAVKTGTTKAAASTVKAYKGVSHAVDVSGKLQNEFRDIGQGVKDTGADFSRGLADFQKQQSSALAEALANIGRGGGQAVGEAAYYSLGGIGEGFGVGAQGAIGGVASGLGGGAATAGSGLAEGVKSLVVPALLVIGLLFLSRKAKT